MSVKTKAPGVTGTTEDAQEKTITALEDNVINALFHAVDTTSWAGVIANFLRGRVPDNPDSLLELALVIRIAPCVPFWQAILSADPEFRTHFESLRVEVFAELGLNLPAKAETLDDVHTWWLEVWR